jgi:TetR/AcrR family transcriptional regulator, mexJK operon transcriptional repressor
MKRSSADMASNEGALESPGRTERKRRAILQEAEALFLERGFDRTSVDEVAARAEVSKQTVYKQFESKAALFIAVVQAMTGPPAAHVHAEMRDPETVAGVQDALMAHGERLLNIALSPKLMRIRRLAISEADRFPDLGRALYENGPLRAIVGLAATLQRWKDRGLLVMDDPMVAATQFNWLVMADPVNRAMFLGELTLTAKQQGQHLSQSVRAFLAAYTRQQ